MAKDDRLKRWTTPDGASRFVVRSWVEMKESELMSVLVWIPEEGRMHRLRTNDLSDVDYEGELKEMDQ